MSVLAFLISTGLVLFGIRLILQGRLGKRVDDHPVCIRCKFDLFGRVETGGRCPECGAEVGTRRGMEIGNRKRQDGLILAGLAILLAGAIPLGFRFAVLVFKIDPIRFEPSIWLVRATVKAPVNSSAECRNLTELLNRVQNGRMGSADLKSLVGSALQQQANLAMPWNPQWGDLIEGLHAKGQLSAADWKMYLAQNEVGLLELRPRISRGDPIPYHYHGEFRGATPASRAGFRWAFTGVVPGCVTSVVWSSSGWGTPFDLDGNLAIAPASWPLLKAGPTSFAANITRLGATTSVNVTGSWTLLKDGEKSVQLYRDETIAAPTANLLTCQAYARRDDISIDVSCDRSPVDLAFDAFIKTPSAEYQSSDCWVAFVRGQKGHGTADFGSIPGIAGKPVYIILRPSAIAAARTLHMEKLLDHEFVLRGVIVKPL